MDLGLKNKNALITGGSRGLGLSSAISLAKEGVNIHICARSSEDLLKAKKMLSKFKVKVHLSEIDLSSENSIQNLYDQSLIEFEHYLCLLYTSDAADE